MKKIFLAVFSVAMLLTACDKAYDDTDIQNRMTRLENRVTNLEAVVNDINANVASLQVLVKALQDNITIDVISKDKEGYTITFSDGVTVTLKNGEKGEKGDQGETGASPVVGVKSYEGVYYWTVDGEWLLANGQKVPVAGAMPQVKVEDGNWFISYDGGENWEDLGPVSGSATSDLVVTEDADFVYFTLVSTGETIKVAKTDRFAIEIASTDYLVTASSTVEIPYNIVGDDGTVKLFIMSDDYTATYDSAKIYITPKEGVSSGDVLVYAVRNSDQRMCGVVLSFSEGVLEVTAAQKVPSEGGVVSVTVRTNIDYEVIIPDDAKDWLSLAPETKEIREDVVTFSVQPNTSSEPRSATVEIRPSLGASIGVIIFQEGYSQYSQITIAEFLALSDDDTETVYQLTGVITEVRHSVYGNFYMQDSTGTVYVYGLQNEEGENVFTPLGLEKGDQVTLHGTRLNYNGTTIEVVNAIYDSHVKGEDIPETVEVVTIAEFLTKPVGNDVWYEVTGKITSITSTVYGNLYLEDESGSVYVYGLTATKQGSNDRSFSSLGLKVGDTLTARGYRAEYNGTDELGGTTPAYYVSHVPGEGGGGGGETEDGYSITWSGQSDWFGIGDDEISYTSGNYTLTAAKNEGSTKPTVNANYNDCRVYAKGTLTVSCTSTMSSLVFKISSQGQRRLTEITSSSGSVSIDTDKWEVTWIGSASSVTFTVGEKATYGTDGDSKAGQFDFDSVLAK